MVSIIRVRSNLRDLTLVCAKDMVRTLGLVLAISLTAALVHVEPA